MNAELKPAEIVELITCALNKTGMMRPFNRVRLRICEHLIGKLLLEAVKPDTVWNQGHYPVIVPTLKPGASVRLTVAGKLAICSLPCIDFGEWFPVAADIQRAKCNCDCPDAEPPEG